MNSKIAENPDHSGLETVDCLFCGSSDSKYWGSESGFDAVKCTKCGLVYVRQRPSAEAIASATVLGQHSTEVGHLDFVYNRSARKLRRYRKRVERLYSDELRAGKPLSWLDVGAGFGELIEALESLLPSHSEIVGIEPMEPKAESARNRGLAVSSRSLDEIDQQFDVVSIVNILSHVPEPGSFLQKLAKLTKPGGSIYLVTGTGGDLATRQEYPDRLELPDHLLFAGREHIEQWLARSGFTVEKVDMQRVDTPISAAKALVKRAMNRPARLTIPYRSKFRDIAVKARRN